MRREYKLSHNNENNAVPSDNVELLVQQKDSTFNSLRPDCDKCFGLCCVALYFSASEGFPVDKDAGQPCTNLQSDFRCTVHNKLWEKGLKGCIAYDCFGAGQKVAQFTFGGQNWQQSKILARQMSEAFIIMRQLHQLLWYLNEAVLLEAARPIYNSLGIKISDTEHLTNLSCNDLMKLDIAAYREEVNILLVQTSDLVRNQVRMSRSSISKHQKRLGRGADLIGADLRKTNLQGKNLRGAYLIAANLKDTDLSGTDLIGADFRDADIRGTDLTKSIFLTQSQINSAKGDSRTKLPSILMRPTHWI
jgi:uncharacterized protein YjbI with pentapeptide repeats